MQLILDTANLDKIEEYLSYLPVHGVTTNPSILKKEDEVQFSEHFKEIRKLIGEDRSLHIQVVSLDYEGILEDAYRILDLVDENVYIKIPVSKEGLKAIKTLKKENINVTATAIYSKIQALIAMDLGADFLAPYVNRMMNLDSDPYDLIRSLAMQIERTNSSTKLLGASFKNINQVVRATEVGSHFVTVGSDVIDTFTENANIEKAVHDFAGDWYSMFNTDTI